MQIDITKKWSTVDYVALSGKKSCFMLFLFTIFYVHVDELPHKKWTQQGWNVNNKFISALSTIPCHKIATMFIAQHSSYKCSEMIIKTIVIFTTNNWRRHCRRMKTKLIYSYSKSFHFQEQQVPLPNALMQLTWSFIKKVKHIIACFNPLHPDSWLSFFLFH